jgi:hypothetical protein
VVRDGKSRTRKDDAMKWMVYSATIVNQITRQEAQQIRRAPVMDGDVAELAAERLGGELLGVQGDVRKAESMRRLTEMQAILAGYNVVEWTAPAEWCRETPRSVAVPRVGGVGKYPRLAAGA